MPEGDTIHALAVRLRTALVPGTVTAFAAQRAAHVPDPEPGERIEEVTARGKHLLFRFEGGATLHTHLGMRGSWRLGPAGQVPAMRQGPPGRGIVAVVATGRATAVCRDTRVVEVLDDSGLRRHRWLSTLGPDLCLPDPDLDEVGRRLAAFVERDTEIGVALLDQRVAAGIGNVYRSEVLWACGVDPSAATASVDDEMRRRLYATASSLLRRNLHGGERRTVPEGLAVYERTGRRCVRCGHAIASRRLGEHARTVWWCPGCQTGAG
jgi:endonuclease-8